MQQKTIKKPVTIEGIGLHSGKFQKVEIFPAEADNGIIINGSRLNIEAVNAEPGCTVFENIMTIEHLLSALSGIFIDNVNIKCYGCEIPILDGSSLPIVKLIEPANLNKSKKIIKVLKKVCFMDENGTTELLPSKKIIFNIEINYPDTPAIGYMKKIFELEEENYCKYIAPARSFARIKDIEYLHKINKALGASFETGILVDGDKIVNIEGLRMPDEFICHKILDAIGDLSTAGKTILAEYRSVKGGHYHNNRLLKILFSTSDNYEICTI